MRYQPRRLATALSRALRTFPAALVTGARQSGKTTLLRNELPRHRYLSLERPDARARALSDPEGFLNDAGAPLVLDEIQYAPVLLHHIKERIDAERRPGRYVLTGSQTFALMKGVSQSLAGRVAVLSLDPLSAGEARGLPETGSLDRVLARVFGPGRGREAGASPLDAADWMLRGGYPEPRLNRRVDREIWLGSYVQTYLERDVRDLLRVSDLESFRRFVFLAATRTGQLLNLADLGGELGISAPTVRQWLSVLQTSHVVYLLRPFHRNLGKRIRKSPKLYFTDVGLATFLLGIHTRPSLLQGPSLGPLLETATVAEWVKAFRGAGLEPPLSFWRTSDGREVDLVIEHGGRLHAIEVKATETPLPAHAANLAAFAALAGPATRTALACRVESPVALRPGVRAVPWHLAW